MDRYCLTYIQKMKITKELPKDWEKKVKNLGLTFDADYYINDFNVWAWKEKDFIVRKTVILFDSELLWRSNDNPLDLAYFADDNIVGIKGHPRFCEVELQEVTCELYEENVDA